ncbi:hypothetical protein B0H13DRAFT_1898988 [Mycena leptocephala]|nr:hypothetical protein B0H13DRAFT_1898988 [Mycena leptocephala]
MIPKSSRLPDGKGIKKTPVSCTEICTRRGVQITGSDFLQEGLQHGKINTFMVEVGKARHSTTYMGTEVNQSTRREPVNEELFGGGMLRVAGAVGGHFDALLKRWWACWASSGGSGRRKRGGIWRTKDTCPFPE